MNHKTNTTRKDAHIAKENETVADIIAEMRSHWKQNIYAEKDKPEYGILTMEGEITLNCADRLEAAHKREIDVLKQRCAELDAEVAAKDEVIKRLNDAISEEQRIKMATAENSSAVGNAAKLREVCKQFLELLAAPIGFEYCGMSLELDEEQVVTWRDRFRAALAEPPRNCDLYDSADEMMEKYADDAFLEEWKKWRETGKCHPLMLDAFLCISWLFLTNEKGETNGSK